MPEVVVQIAPDEPLQTDATSQGGSQGPFAAAMSLGHTLKPIHEGSNDPALSRWFHVTVDNDKVGELVNALQNNPGVTAAFVKPQAEPP